MVTRVWKEKYIHFFQLHILGPQIYSKGLFISRIPKADQKSFAYLWLSSRAVAICWVICSGSWSSSSCILILILTLTHMIFSPVWHEISESTGR